MDKPDIKKLSRLRRIKQPQEGVVKLSLARIFILPTRRGLLMLSTIALLLLMGLSDNNNLIYFLGFLLFSVFFTTILHTYRNLAGLEIQAGYPPPVFAGEAAGFTITVNNPFNQTRTGLAASLDSSEIFSLRPYASRTLCLYAPARQRGWQAIGALNLAGVFPLGIFRAWSPVTFAVKVLVYPKPAADARPFPPISGSGGDERRRHDIHGNDDYYGARPYQAGDSIRQIHWRTYAKGQGLYSKQYAETASGGELWLDFAHTPGAHPEERLSRLCRWIIDAEEAGLNYGLKLPTVTIEPAGGKQHYAACLEALALF
ncbi:MAG: DUF58 domain-containing protein [Methylomonas sp.]|jgi:uncharacterized protein (DUF58 family)